MRLRIIAAFIGLLLSPCQHALAGAWNYPEGKGQVIVTTTFADANKAYDASGRLINTPSYRKFETRAYWEHGVTDWFTAVGEAGYLNFRGDGSALDYINLLTAQAKARVPLSPKAPPGPRYEGFGVGALGGRVKLLTYGDYVFSIEASLRTASGDARRFLDMRDTLQVDARAQIGRGFEIFGFHGYLDTQIGYRSRGQNGDEIRADFTAGIRPLPYVLVMAQSFTALSPRGGPAGAVAAQKFQLSGVYDVNDWLSVQVGGVVGLSGVNSPAERGVLTAAWLRY